MCLLNKRLNMQNLLKIFVFVLMTSSLANAAQISEMTVKSFFPKVDQLEGGSELWLNTGVRSKKR